MCILKKHIYIDLYIKYMCIYIQILFTFIHMCVYLCIHNKYTQYTYIVCKHKLLYRMQLIAINHFAVINKIKYQHDE